VQKKKNSTSLHHAVCRMWAERASRTRMTNHKREGQKREDHALHSSQLNPSTPVPVPQQSRLSHLLPRQKQQEQHTEEHHTPSHCQGLAETKEELIANVLPVLERPLPSDGSKDAWVSAWRRSVQNLVQRHEHRKATTRCNTPPPPQHWDTNVHSFSISTN